MILTKDDNQGVRQVLQLRLPGQIPYLSVPGYDRRSLEIEKWIAENATSGGFWLCLDDSFGTGTMTRYLVKTQSNQGLITQHILESKRVLSDQGLQLV